MKTQPIERIRKQFHKEWLLIAIDEMNPVKLIPRGGHLLAHSPNRDEIYKAMMCRKRLTLVAYSDDRLPAGYAAAF